MTDSNEATFRVFERGRFHYRFRCPDCSTYRMALTGMDVVREEGSNGLEPRAEFKLVCLGCGTKRVIRDLPIASHLTQ